MASYFVLAAVLVAYAFWIYLRVELPVPAAKRLAVIRACVLAVILLLLFDPRIPMGDSSGASPRWALVDASMSMSARAEGGASAWEGASARAEELRAAGWNVVRFGDGTLVPDDSGAAEPDRLESLLGPALSSAAEAGAREVRVLSDFRLEDAVAIRAALEALPLTVEFESFGEAVDNAGVGRFDVPDVVQPDGRPTAEVEVHGGTPGDSVSVEIFEEDRSVATVRVGAPTEGLRTTVTVELPAPASQGRIRYVARVVTSGDAFEADDEAVDYANVGYEEGALVLVSMTPDWEPRYLLPVLEDVTGLSGVGFVRAGDDRFVRMGRAADRGQPADSSTVRRAAVDAAILVVHGIGASSEPWLTELVQRPGRRLILPADAEGARSVGLVVDAPRAGEWYASPEIPTSPIAGALVGVSLQGLPPLTAVMVPETSASLSPLDLQLRGAGAPESAFRLVGRPSGRAVVALASGFWRWAARDGGREPYRRVWSGVAGWLLADQSVVAAEARPTEWVVPRAEPVRWSVPGDTARSRIVVSSDEEVVLDTTMAGGNVTTGVLPPGPYAYAVTTAAGDTLGVGRFDVGRSTSEMVPARVVPELPVRAASMAVGDEGRGRPLRTFPWPYLLVIVLLCVEWVLRRRTGLR